MRSHRKAHWAPFGPGRHRNAEGSPQSSSSQHASVHIPGASRPLSMWHRELPSELTAAAYMSLHLDELERFAAEMPVDILSHPTLLPLPIREPPEDELWTDALEERLVDALFHAEIAFEISNRYRPPERLVKRAHDRGVRLSLGSDGHTRAQPQSGRQRYEHGHDGISTGERA